MDTSLDPQVAVTKVPLVANQRSMDWVTEKVSTIVEARTPIWWWVAFLITSPIAAFGLCCIAYQISTGVGVWGENHPVGWAWDITNFVFWIGIGHAGTLISAILFLTRQKWRTSINRSAEAMTLFAVVCAGIFPGIHVGRVWMAWFLAPVPWYEGVWPNFRSPLLWDVFAVSTYFTVSVLFWYTGLVPDLATLRDRATSRVKKFFFTVFALGWRGSNRNWRHYEMAYLILAGISTPLVLSVHSVVSFDFATSVIPGWHTTIFPPYFVAGAIFGGFAMVLTILIPARILYPQLKDLITPQHIDRMCKIILLTGSIVGYAYAMEFFIAFYAGNPNEQWAFLRNRFADPYVFGPMLHVTPAPFWWAYWCMLTCNVVSPQFFWFKKLRYNLWVVFIIVNFVNAGMWFERFVIIVTSIANDFLPSMWHSYHPTWVEKGTFLGTFGIFLSLFLLFMRYLPMIAMSEIKIVLPESDPHHAAPGSHGDAEAHQPEHLMIAAAQQPKVYGIAAEFPSAAALYHAAEQIRDAGFKRWDVYTPFPVHGMDKAMGLGKSWLSAVVLCGGLTGLLTAVVLESYPSLIEYQTVVHGKPTDWATVPAFVPIFFELTILCSAFACVIALMVMSQLPRWNHPMFNWERFSRVGDNGFFLAIEARDLKFSEEKTRALLESIGGHHVTLIHDY